MDILNNIIAPYGINVSDPSTDLVTGGLSSTLFLRGSITSVNEHNVNLPSKFAVGYKSYVDTERGNATTCSMYVSSVRNIYIQRHLSGIHPNIIAPIGCIQPSSPSDLDKSIILYPHVGDVSMATLLNAKTVEFNLDCLRVVAFDMLSMLEVSHAHGIVHRNLKPEKYIVNPVIPPEGLGSIVGDIGVFRAYMCDWTPANFRPLPKASSSGPQHAPEGLVSALYRASEVFSEVIRAETESRPLNINALDPRLDIWSVGVMLAKMAPRLTGCRRLPFIPAGPTEKHIVKSILQGFGWKEGMTDMTPDIKTLPHLFDEFRIQKDGEPYDHMALDPLFPDFLKCLLAFQISDRYSADQALDHPFLKITEEVERRCPNYTAIRREYNSRVRPAPASTRNRYLKNTSELVNPDRPSEDVKMPQQFNDLWDLRFTDSEHFHTNINSPHACHGAKIMYTESQVTLFRELTATVDSKKQHEYHPRPPVNNIWTSTPVCLSDHEVRVKFADLLITHPTASYLELLAMYRRVTYPTPAGHVGPSVPAMSPSGNVSESGGVINDVEMNTEMTDNEESS
jgi:serine/threonine protein kinase